MKKADILEAFQKKKELLDKEFAEKKIQLQKRLVTEREEIQNQIQNHQSALVKERNESQHLNEEVDRLVNQERELTESISTGREWLEDTRRGMKQTSRFLQEQQDLLKQQQIALEKENEQTLDNSQNFESAKKKIKIRSLGTLGMGVRPKGMNKKSLGLVIEFGEKKLMLDCGEEDFLKENPDWIFLTRPGKGLANGTHHPVYLTQNTLNKIKYYPLEDITLIGSNKKYQLGDFTLSTFSTAPGSAIGFKISVADQTVIYAPHMIGTKNYKEVFNDAILLIGDGSAFRKDQLQGTQSMNANLLKIYRWAKNADVKNIIFTNFGSWIHETTPIAAFEEINASPMFDGSELSISSNRLSATPTKRPEAKEPQEDYSKNKELYSDPANWELPFSTKELTLKSYDYFKEPKNYTKYSKIERNHIRNCIKQAWRRFNLGKWQNFSKAKRFVLQSHWRGSSEHKDLRFAVDDHLVGFTLADQEENVAKELVGSHWNLKKTGPNVELYWDDRLFYRIEKKTEKILAKPSEALKTTVLAHHKRLEDVNRLWKVDWKGGGEEKKRPAPKGEEGTREKIWSSTKATQPKGWLKAEGVTLPRAIEKAPGGTEFYPGIFVVVDKGIYYPGAMKPYFMEFFPRGKKLSGRIVLRLVPGLKNKKLLNWMYWKPDDQLPYVLGKRAVKENWLPAEGSALPPEWEAKIPSQFKYWNKTGTKAQLLARAQAINYLIEKGTIKERRKIKIQGEDFKKGSFLLTERSWKGQKVVRGIPVTDFHLKINGKQFHLTKSPLWKNEIPAQLFTGSPGYFKEGTKAPQTELNPNKKIPAYVKTIDSGPIRIIEESTNSIKLQFLGKKLKGPWVFLRTSAKDPIWSMVKSPSPKSFNFMFRDFQKLKEVKTSKDIKFPYTFRGIAFAEGTWHNEFYPWKVIKAAADELVGVSLVLDHKDSDVLDTVGDITEVFKNDEKKWIEFNGILYDTEKGRDTALLVENEKIGGLSARLTDSFTYNADGIKEAEEILDWQHVAFVVDPEVSIAKVCNHEGVKTCS